MKVNTRGKRKRKTIITLYVIALMIYRLGYLLIFFRDNRIAALTEWCRFAEDLGLRRRSKETA